MTAEKSEESKSEEWRKEERERAVENRKRLLLFETQEITATAVQREIGSIFDKLQKRVANRVTETTIEYYRRKKLKDVRLLQDDESLRYLYEQISRYITFNPNAMKEQCDFLLLKKILCRTTEFRKDYEIDEETIPKMVKHNERFIQALYKHLKGIYKETQFPMDLKKPKMALEDALSIIILYQRVFSTAKEKIIDSADEFVVNQSIFCKFVDPTFSVDAPSEKWSDKTKAAANLYQSVLDIQQNFVTLGQVRQTINMLISDLTDGMKAGELIRLLNHIGKKARQDAERCADERRVYTRQMRGMSFEKISSRQLHPDILAAGPSLSQEEVIQNGGDGGAGGFSDTETSGASSMRLKAKSTTDKVRKRNPSLRFEHIRAAQWNAYIANIANRFHMDIKSRTIYQKLHQKFDENDHLIRKLSTLLDDVDGVDESTTIRSDEPDEKEQTLFDTILDITQFDIYNTAEVDALAMVKENEVPADVPSDDEKKEDGDNQEEEKETPLKRRLRSSRLEIFDTMLSGLLYSFNLSFCRF